VYKKLIKWFQTLGKSNQLKGWFFYGKSRFKCFASAAGDISITVTGYFAP